MFYHLPLIISFSPKWKQSRIAEDPTRLVAVVVRSIGLPSSRRGRRSFASPSVENNATQKFRPFFLKGTVDTNGGAIGSVPAVGDRSAPMSALQS